MSEYTQELMYRLGQALQQAGFTRVEISDLIEDPLLLKQLLSVLHHLSEIVPKEYVIDCDAEPRVPNNLTLVEHRSLGQLVWNPTQVKLMQSAKQQADQFVTGFKLAELMSRRLALNANVLDFLLDHPYLIPRVWQGKRIYFWGTVYNEQNGQCVRCLVYINDEWTDDYFWIHSHFNSQAFAAYVVS